MIHRRSIQLKHFVKKQKEIRRLKKIKDEQRNK